jgi:hypothetical protein
MAIAGLSWGQSTFRFEGNIQLNGLSHTEIFKKVINWHTGARRTQNIDKVFSESDILSSQKTVWLSDNSSSFMQTGLDIKIAKPHRTVVSFTIKFEIKDGVCHYLIDNFYYKMDVDQKGECYQYISIDNNPPESCSTVWGLAFYKNVMKNTQNITTDYIENYLIPELKMWLAKN